MEIIAQITYGLVHHGVTFATGAVLVVMHDMHQRRAGDHHLTITHTLTRAARWVLRRPQREPVNLRKAR